MHWIMLTPMPDLANGRLGLMMSWAEELTERLDRPHVVKQYMCGDQA